MTICPRCKHDNLTGELLCSSCGYPLVAKLDTRKLDEVSADVLPLPATGDTRLLDKMLLRLELSDGKRISAAFGASDDELSVGRFVPDTSGKPDVDLADHDALTLGVSRFHAKLNRTGTNVSITDLNSTNGTWVNGQRLRSGQPLYLHDADEIFFGHLKLTIWFVR